MVKETTMKITISKKEVWIVLVGLWKVPAEKSSSAIESLSKVFKAEKDDNAKIEINLNREDMGIVLLWLWELKAKISAWLLLSLGQIYQSFDLIKSKAQELSDNSKDKTKAKKKK